MAGHTDRYQNFCRTRFEGVTIEGLSAHEPHECSVCRQSADCQMSIFFALEQIAILARIMNPPTMVIGIV